MGNHLRILAPRRNSDDFPPDDTCSHQRSGATEQPPKGSREVDKNTTRNEPGDPIPQAFLSILREEDLEFPGLKVAESSWFWNELPASFYSEALEGARKAPKAN